MTKSSKKSAGAWVSGLAFAMFSGAVALGWTHGVDLWVLQTVQGYSSYFLDSVLRVFSVPGGVEVSTAALLLLLTGLFSLGRQALAGRLLAVFMATGVLELVLKFLLPQAEILEDGARADEYAPLVVVLSPHPYPSGHMLRSVILFGALYLLSRNRFLRVASLAVLAGVAANRVYFGVHWSSDVVGGALLGLAGLLWAFGGKAGQRFSSSAFQQEDEQQTSA